MKTAANVQLRLMDSADKVLYESLFGDKMTLRHVTPPLGADESARAFGVACRGNIVFPPRLRHWVITDMTTAQDAGLLGLAWDGDETAELGVVLPPRFQGHGYATAAIRAASQLAFETLQLQLLRTRHNPENTLAFGLMTKLGFERLPDQSDPYRCRWQLSKDRWQAGRNS